MLWVISEGVVIRDIEAGRLRYLPVDTTETRGAVGLTTQEGQSQPPHSTSSDGRCGRWRKIWRFRKPSAFLAGIAAPSLFEPLSLKGEGACKSDNRRVALLP